MVRPDGDFQSIDDLRQAGKGLSQEELLQQLLYATRQLPRARRWRENYNPWGVKLTLLPQTDAPPATGSVSAFSGQAITPIDTPDDKDERDWVITWRLHALPTGFGGASPSSTCGVVQVIITYTQGQANYSIGPFPVVDTQHHTLPYVLTARKVTLSAKWSGVVFGGPTLYPALPFSASVGETSADHAQALAGNPPTWFRTPSGLYLTEAASGGVLVQSANAAVPVPTSGNFRAMVGSVATSSLGATTPVYIMLFDSPAGTQPVAGALPLWTSDPIVPGQGTSSFDATGQTNWNYGLWVAMSSYPGALVPITGLCACDVAGG